jgi:hypothetical protein
MAGKVVDRGAPLASHRERSTAEPQPNLTADSRKRTLTVAEDSQRANVGWFQTSPKVETVDIWPKGPDINLRWSACVCGAAGKAASLMGWKSPVVNCPIRTTSISGARGGNEP